MDNSQLTRLTITSQEFFDSASSSLHGEKKANKATGLLDRQRLISNLIEEEGITLQEMRHSFSDTSGLSVGQKEKLAQSLLLCSESSSTSKEQKEVINHCLNTEEFGKRILEKFPKNADKILTESTRLDGETISASGAKKAADDAVTLQNNQIFLGELKSFVANVITDDNKEATLQDIKASLGQDFESRLHLSEIQPTAVNGLSKKFDDALLAEDKPLKESLDDLVEQLEQSNTLDEDKLLASTKLDSMDDIREKLLLIVGEISESGDPEAEKLLDSITPLATEEYLDRLLEAESENGIDNEPPPPLTVVGHDSELSGGNEHGLITGKVDRTYRVEKDDFDYHQAAKQMMQDNDFTLVRKNTTLSRAREFASLVSKPTSEEDIINNLLGSDKKEAPPLAPEASSFKKFGNFLKSRTSKEPSESTHPIEDTLKLAEKESKQDRGVSILKDSNGHELVKLDDRKSFFNHYKGGEPNFRGMYGQAGMMNPNAHMITALKAMESGIKSPLIILPTTKGVSDKQKLDFYKSNLSALLEAGYKPENISLHQGKVFGRISKDLEANIEEAREEIYARHAAKELANDTKFGLVGDADSLNAHFDDPDIARQLEGMEDLTADEQAQQVRQSLEQKESAAADELTEQKGTLPEVPIATGEFIPEPSEANDLKSNLESKLEQQTTPEVEVPKEEKPAPRAPRAPKM